MTRERANRLFTRALRHLETDRGSFYELSVAAAQGQVQRFLSGKNPLAKIDSKEQLDNWIYYFVPFI